MSEQRDSQQPSRDAEAKKNRPTPSRREQEKARRRPLVPEDRKTANAQARAEMRRQRDHARERMMEGDERYLPPRDIGPQRRYIRDYVDARYSFGELLIPVSLIVLIVGLFAHSPAAQQVSVFVIYGLLAAVVLDAFIMRFALHRRLGRRFGAENIQKGYTLYAVMRSIQLRVLRTPRPQVKRREFPE